MHWAYEAAELKRLHEELAELEKRAGIFDDARYSRGQIRKAYFSVGDLTARRALIAKQIQISAHRDRSEEDKQAAERRGILLEAATGPHAQSYIVPLQLAVLFVGYLAYRWWGVLAGAIFGLAAGRSMAKSYTSAINLAVDRTIERLDQWELDRQKRVAQSLRDQPFFSHEEEASGEDSEREPAEKA